MAKPVIRRTPRDELALLRRLRTFVEGMIEDPTDRQTVFDTLEGIEDVDKAFGRLVDLSHDLKAYAEAKKVRAKQYSDAAEADFQNRKRVGKILQLMLIEIDQRSWKGLEGGVNQRRGSLSVEIVDPAAIPFEFLKPVPDIGRIGDFLKADGLREPAEDQLIRKEIPREIFVHPNIPGARLVRSPDTVAINKPEAAGTSTEEDG